MPLSDTLKRIMDLSFDNKERPKPSVPGKSIQSKSQIDFSSNKDKDNKSLSQVSVSNKSKNKVSSN